MNSIANILVDREYELQQALYPTQSLKEPVNINTTNNVIPTSMPQNNEPEENKQPTTSSEANEKTLGQLKTMIYAMKDQLDGMLRVVNGEQVNVNREQNPDTTLLHTGERIIEGVFNGQKMIGPDGKEYAVPPNYASKSKLVEGDMMKLTITNNGSFIYKQIGPIKRKRITGELVNDDGTGQWKVLVDGKTYKILTASVTFYKGKGGDETVIFIPEESDSEWGAVEHIINKE